MCKISLVFVLALCSSRAVADDVAFPPELVKFTQERKAPVFTGGGPGAWDAKIRERGWILREQGVWKLWYTGYDGTKEGIRRLGYATSRDGLSWTRHAKNPLLPDVWVEDMTVVKRDGVYYMFAEGRGDRAHLLISRDGVQWEPKGTLDVRKKDGTPIAEGPFGSPTVWGEDGVWRLFYERNDLGVWLATSNDMKVWTNVQDEPVMTPGPREFEKDLIAFNQIVKHENRYYALYHGSAKTGPFAKLWSTSIAVSTDLVRWHKYAGNPLLPSKANQSSGLLIRDGRRFLLYTMHPEVFVHEPGR